MNKDIDDSVAGALGILTFIIGWLVIIYLDEIIAVFVAAVITGLKIMAVMFIGYLLLKFIEGVLSGLQKSVEGPLREHERGLGESRRETPYIAPRRIDEQAYNGSIYGDESLRFTEEESRAIKGRERRTR